MYMPEKDPADPSDQPPRVKTCGRVRLPYIFAVRCGRKDGDRAGHGDQGPGEGREGGFAFEKSNIQLG